MHLEPARKMGPSGPVLPVVLALWLALCPPIYGQIITDEAANGTSTRSATGDDHITTGRPATGAQITGTPATGTPATGTPATGAQITGTPATGTPATGTPATGTPATGTPTIGSPAGTTTLAHEDLDATLWMQSSAEYRASCLQTYRSAIRRLGAQLVEANATAALEQQAVMNDPKQKTHPLPPAVILDVDETVLDNSAYQAFMIETGRQYDPGDWDEWTSTQTSPPVPGAKEFLDACRRAGVTPFFVTNRRSTTKDATRANLEKFGLIDPWTKDGSTPDTLLCKNDQPTWTSDKTTRRAHIAKSYRILLLLGDDLNDFVSLGVHPSPEARRQIASEHSSRWGDTWFSLPNPTYGGWERSVHGWRDASDRETKLKHKRAALNLGIDAKEATSSN